MSQTIDPDEIARFDKVAQTWWDLKGPYKALHALNPARIGYLRDQICFHFGRDSFAARPLEGLRIVDIGCGGGLVCEPLSRLGAHIMGVDASDQNIGVARAHAQQMDLGITYHAGDAADLIGKEEPFDVVLALEVVEHVADVATFLSDCRALLKDGGGFGYSTINKTAASLAVAKIGAEYVARLVPKGTHDWRKFIRPKAMEQALKQASLEPWDSVGLVPDVVQRSWRTGPIKAINYIGWARAA
ncbi:MAG: bifunctional 2-polyprenyl-6-hydroxyphenol methylase/3-demethylubiquinol 3-O-methyltransferase UbiG [Pseudomonadota bacterium]